MALTPAERQQRRRNKLAALRPPDAPELLHPLADRQTRQEAWDDACETLEDLLETYRRWRLSTPTPHDALSSAALPSLAGLIQALTMVSLPAPFAGSWHLPGLDTHEAEQLAAVPGRTLRERFFGADPTPEPDEPRRTPEQDEKARAWWARLPEAAQETWRGAAHCTEPEDVFHVLHRVLKSIG